MKDYIFALQKDGFYQITNAPDIDELKKYYAEKYWQEVTGFKSELSETEKSYIENTVTLKGYVVDKFLPSGLNRLLDLGTGEGHTLKYFSDRNWEVLGLDFSDFGVKKHYPDLLSKVITGDVYESLDDLLVQERRFSLVVLDNILEHVLDPENLIIKIKHVLNDTDSAVLVRVPNDFTFLQSFLKKNKIVNKDYWVAPPDHLNYFNSTNLSRFFEKLGFSMKIMYSDWPIELDLLNPNTNYVNNKNLGKESNLARMMTENIIGNSSKEDALNFYVAAAKIGLGRTITALFQPKKV
jgi:2-polyprenyl-3-methyl-5-hydroxy-6-metoxy-1,4-benzoquinol methylase